MLKETDALSSSEWRQREKCGDTRRKVILPVDCTNLLITIRSRCRAFLAKVVVPQGGGVP